MKVLFVSNKINNYSQEIPEEDRIKPNEIVAWAIKSLLGSKYKFKIYNCHNHPDIVKKLQKNKFVLIVMEESINSMCSYDFIRNFREKNNTPVIFYSKEKNLRKIDFNHSVKICGEDTFKATEKALQKFGLIKI